MLSDDESSKPKTLTEPDNGDGDDGSPPRRPTAVGAGGSDEDFDKGIEEFRQCDLSEYFNEADLRSWAVPEITFVRLDSILLSESIDKEPKQPDKQPQQNQDPNQIPKRMYLMEDALTGMNSQKAYISFALIGSKVGVNCFMGMSLQQPPEGIGQNLDSVCYNIQKSILHSVYNGIDVHEKIYSSVDLKEMIEPLANYVGVVTGTPSLKSQAIDAFDGHQIDRIVQGLRGLDFGILALAAPIPQKMLSDEEYIVLDQIQKAQVKTAGEKKRRVKYYLEVQNAYLRHLQLGQSIGHWQAGIYFFARTPDVFVRLRSLIKATYTDEGIRPRTLRTYDLKGLKKHLLDFGLLRNHRVESPIHHLLQYHFLTPLNSRMLSAFIHLPSELPIGTGD